jgi:hypothetical protein
MLVSVVAGETTSVDFEQSTGSGTATTSAPASCAPPSAPSWWFAARRPAHAATEHTAKAATMRVVTTRGRIRPR